MTKLIFWLAAVVAILGAMVRDVGPGGSLGFMIWLAALIAALIMVRRSWPDTGGGADDGES